MATCKECVHVEVCRFKDFSAPLSDSYIRESECIEKRCGDFKDRSRFVEIPYPISVGYKLSYIYVDDDGKIKVGENYEVITRVCDAGFYVSHWLNSDGIYRLEDDFYPWSAIGDEYFLTREVAERALKERESNGQSQN